MQPNDALPLVSNTLAAFKSSFYVLHERMPTAQEIWDAGVRSGLNRAKQSTDENQANERRATGTAHQ